MFSAPTEGAYDANRRISTLHGLQLPGSQPIIDQVPRTTTFHNGFQEQREASSCVSRYRPGVGICSVQLPTPYAMASLKGISIFCHVNFSLQAPSLVMDQSNPLANLTFSMIDAEKNCTAAGPSAAHILQFQYNSDSFPLLSLRELVTFCSNATIANGTDGNLVDWYSFTEATAADSVENFVWEVQSNTCPTRLLPKLGVGGKPGFGRYWYMLHI
ncbi:hypothetical protein QBC45DRAFT_175103 [Copromyces sp. CBS 386.78]|nr:hypothetical protein QBC45DRAFT_175103 [Copromyces sp. CBS 386.78]